MSQPSILVAGAGPAGLILAIILLKNGVPVRLIDKAATYPIGSRGAGVQPRTLELYDILGVLPEFEKVADTTCPVRRMYGLKDGVEVVLKEGPVFQRVEPTPGTPHANPVALSQDVHEEILRSYLHTLGGAVELSTELRSFEQSPDHVVAQIVKNGVVESARFDWLVGADGVHSCVRKQLGLSFLGETKEEQHVLVGDIVVEGLEREFWHYWIPQGKMLVLRPGTAASNGFRFAFTGGPEQWKQTPPTRTEFIKEFHAVTGRRDVRFGQMTWLSSFKPSMRMVDQFGRGRVFVAGDAAHCHSPTGGQGLNSSVQDAANLGWKLALVARGRAPAALLASYTEERRPVIAQMLQLTTALHEKTAAQVAAGAVEGDAWQRGGALGMLGVNARGAIVLGAGAGAGANTGAGAYDAAAGGVQGGYRAPDAPGLAGAAPRLFALFGPAAHTALVFGGDAAAHAAVAGALEAWPHGTVRAVLVRKAGAAAEETPFGEVVEDRAGHAYAEYVPGAAEGALTVVVVRPDGVVGAVIPDVEDIARYGSLIFG
ncbi:FAD binding domain-containing protein [Mycena belliarum]|uniref:FAD binding domain-containing protein n=1 Tax=Mycena belliarum TaxID=1033014 RepID=A0AAD6TWX7_9AGAR|nr:FAD binding domain-containing protein [Mycena belliae]